MARLLGPMLVAFAWCSATAADVEMRWGGPYTMANSSKGATIMQSPAVGSDGTVYVSVSIAGTAGAVVAIPGTVEVNPKEKWRFPRRNAEFWATPAIGPDGNIYVGALDGIFYCIDKNTGLELWEYNTTFETNGQQLTYIESAATFSRDGTLVYIPIHTFGTGRAAVLAMSLDGRLRPWIHWFPTAVQAAPVVGDDGTLYVGCFDQNFYAIDSDGNEKWHVPLDGAIIASAALGGDGTIYIGTISNQFAAISREGKLKWSLPMIVPSTAAIGPDGTLYVGNFAEATYNAITPSETEGTIKWRISSVIGDGSAATVRADGTILFAGGDGLVRACNSKGELLWSFSTGDQILGAPAVAPTPDHSIYVGTTGGLLYSLRGNGYGLSEYSSWPTFQHDAQRTGRAGEHVGGGQLVNLSTRGRAGPGTNLIAGVLVKGSGAKPFLLRAVGPTLRDFSISSALANPSLTVFQTQPPSISLVAARNDDWGVNDYPGDIAAVGASVGAFPLPVGSKDAATVTNVNSAFGYSVNVASQDGSSGVALVEVYDAKREDPSVRLVNLSTRGSVGTGDNTLIAGLIVDGPGTLRVLIRAVGPGLTAYGVPNVLAQPSVSVFNANSERIATNTTWTSSNFPKGDIAGAAALVGAFPLSDTSADSALLMTLTPGLNTIQVAGVGGTTGEVLLEVYALPY